MPLSEKNDKTNNETALYETHILVRSAALLFLTWQPLDAKGKPYTVRYEAVNAMLLNEFLKEHRRVEEQQATIAELIALVFTLTTINAWNRLAITMRTDVGNYQPKARPVSQTAHVTTESQLRRKVR